MLRRCCFCFDLYRGSLLVAACRLAVWLLIFVGTLWVTVQVFSADRGVIVYQAWLDIEQNGEFAFTETCDRYHVLTQTQSVGSNFANTIFIG